MVNIDQFKSYFYADFVYYQKPYRYTYASAKPAAQPDPTSISSGGTYPETVNGVTYSLN